VTTQNSITAKVSSLLVIQFFRFKALSAIIARDTAQRRFTVDNIKTATTTNDQNNGVHHNKALA